MSVFLLALISFMLLFDFMVKQITYKQVEQDLLGKAKQVNSALNQLQPPTATSELIAIYYESAKENREKALQLFEVGLISKAEYEQMEEAYRKADSLQKSAQIQSRQELINFLANIFAATITVFDENGLILETSAEQENVPGSKVDARFSQVFNTGEIIVTKVASKKTGYLDFFAVVPVVNNQNGIEKGILLEINPLNLDHSLHKMRLYLLTIGMSILVIIILISVFLAMSISMPISRLSTSVAEINQDGSELPFEDQSLEEINILTRQLGKIVFQLQNVRAESSKLEEERERLFSEISHELRTPLTSIQGFVEAIRDGMVNDEGMLKKYLNTIHTQTIHLNRLVDDILVLSRLESGNISVQKQPLDLCVLAQSVITSMETEAKTKNNLLVLKKQTEKAIVFGDVDRMEQIIRNLLKNAIKATRNGIIKIALTVNPDEKILLSIRDNGIGIAPEDLAHIWDRFYRVKHYREDDDRDQGSGLGLAIVKNLVKLQDGEIDVESELGKGTVFRVSFPQIK